MSETIFQHWIVTKFMLPFVLITGLVYAILEKTNLFGEDKHQINAIISGVIGLIFVGAVYPKLVVENMVLFLAVAVVIVFIVLLLWAFVSGKDMKENILSNTGVKWVVGIGLVVVVAIAVLWATGVDATVIDFLFKQSWSNSFWTNFFFIVIVAVVLAIIWKNKGSD